MANQNTLNNQKSSASGQYLTQMFIIGGLFFIFGFITWLNGTLIPFLKLACDLKTDAQAFFVTFAFFMAYFFLSLPSSWILQRTGFKRGMALGLFIMALGSLVFIPAAQSRSFSLFLVGLFTQGMGLALLQTASNPYISIIGDIKSAAQRISIMGICNKVAGALSPIVLGAILLKNAGELEAKVKAAVDPAVKAQLLDELAARIVSPYFIMALILMAVAALIWFSSLPEINEADLATDDDDDTVVAKNNIFEYPHVWLGALCIFMYVGAEVMAGDIIGSYGKQLGMGLDETKYFTSFTLVAMLAGYVLSIFTIPRYISQNNALLVSAVLGIVLALGAFLSNGYVSVTFVAALGLANAPMWPAIFPLGIKDLGQFTKLGSALLVMGIVGGAIIPQIYGALALVPAIGFKLAFLLCVVPCYLYILYFALAGHKVGQGK